VDAGIPAINGENPNTQIQKISPFHWDVMRDTFWKNADIYEVAYAKILPLIRTQNQSGQSRIRTLFVLPKFQKFTGMFY